VKFRRKNSEQAEAQAADPVESPESPEQADPSTPGDPGATSASAGRGGGPFDVSEVELDEEDQARVDLGGLIVKGRPGIELRLQVDEASQQVAAVLLVAEEGALELRPFAAPRNGDIWGDVRKQIAAETARRGGTATEAEGSYGTELRVMMPVKTPEGKAATQPSRVLGIAGPRWLLRATLLGRPAVEPDEQGALESALRDVVVVRGGSPMAPGEPLPLVMPSNARPAPGQDS
jgi:hypothetical protein